MPYYVCAAAFDYKGNVTPMWMSELISWSLEDAKPIEELDGGAEIQLMSVKSMK